MIWVTNLSGADLNAACSGLTEARPMDGPSNERRNTAAATRTKGIPKVIDVAARQQVNESQ
ncbi:hypothetical protein B4916_01695 [Yersinia intermedia]|nr:hypothetical protein B4916_01695 [Yersinia intermedia]